MFIYLIQFLLFLSFICLTMILYLTLKNKKNRAMIGIIFIISASYFWLIGAYSEIISSTEKVMLFWRNFTQIGVCFLPAAMIYFSTEFTFVSEKTRNFWICIISILSAIAVILLWTDSQHHLMRISTEVVENRLGSIIKVRSTTFGLILMSYVSASHLISEVFILIFLRTAVPRIRRQLYLLSVGLAFPIIFIMLKSFFPLAALLNYPTPVVFIPMSIFVGIAMFRVDNSFSPIVLTEIFNAIDEIIVITDPDRGVIDLNNNAEDLFLSFSCEQQIENGNKDYGSIIKNISANWYEDLLNKSKGQTEFTINMKEMEMFYIVTVHPLYNPRNRFLGCISVLRDISDEQKIKRKLINRAETDGLTGCLNKTEFERRVEQILSNQYMKNEDTALIMFDLDFFKSINDDFGHIVGDRVLEAVSGRTRNVINPEDLFGRLGGEEFGILITGVSREVISGIAERIRKAIQSVKISADNKQVSLTASFGCSIIDKSAVLKDHCKSAKKFIEQADDALYHAKSSGRNRVCWFEE